jgi:hypothetical protein
MQHKPMTMRVEATSGNTYLAEPWAAVAGSIVSLMLCAPVWAADLNGQVLGAGAPISNSTVTLWAASSGQPKQLAQAKTDSNGAFSLSAAVEKDDSLYLIATGGRAAADKSGAENPAIALMLVLGRAPPAKVTVSEFTTIASVVTHNQFIDGTVIRGTPLQLRITAGNVPNFANLATGSYGVAIADALNGSQTPTLANFTTLANVLAGCITQVKPGACGSVFAAAKGPTGSIPTDTLSAIESILRSPSYQPERTFALFDQFYPFPKGNVVRRPTPFTPYLTFAPSAWVLPIKFTGGGFAGGGKLMFDNEGNAWTADNFMMGSQSQSFRWDGTLSKFAPNGEPLSPPVTGFTGGGLGGPGFGLTLDAQENVWLTSTGTNSISKFDKTGKPLSPPDGWNFNGRLGKMQGVIATPSGDIWAIDTMKAQVVYLPKGDPSNAKFFCQNTTKDPLKNPCKLLAPFHLAIDQQDRIWITNLLGDHVSRFPASDPTKVETFKAGWSGSGMAVDSLGNIWVTNKLGSSPRGALKQAEMAATFAVKTGSDSDPADRITKVLVEAMVVQKAGYEGGSVTVLRPDGSEASFSPIYGKGITGPWAVAIDGNDHAWVTNLTTAAAGVVELCGFRTETCPPGTKTGDAISPPGGYVGGGLQLQVDAQIGPAGDVWVTNNWQYYQAEFGQGPEAYSTLGPGQGVVVFYGMAKPVKTPLIGPPRAP